MKLIQLRLAVRETKDGSREYYLEELTTWGILWEPSNRMEPTMDLEKARKEIRSLRENKVNYYIEEPANIR